MDVGAFYAEVAASWLWGPFAASILSIFLASHRTEFVSYSGVTQHPKMASSELLESLGMKVQPLVP